MTKTTKKEYEEEKYKTIQRLKFEIKELKELNIDLQLRFRNTFSQSEVDNREKIIINDLKKEFELINKRELEQLRQELKEGLFKLGYYEDSDIEVVQRGEAEVMIDSVFAKYGVELNVDGGGFSSSKGSDKTPRKSIEGLNPSNPNKCSCDCGCEAEGLDNDNLCLSCFCGCTRRTKE